MIKRIALLVTIAILSLSASVLAAEAGSGIIEGQVVNGTEGGSSIADQDITLKTYLNDSEVDSAVTKTGADGHFVFDGLSTESGYSYQVTLTFQQADYTGDWLTFNDGETSKFSEVIVYDATTSDESIKVATAHTIIYVEPGSLWVVEYFLFVNEADRTYIGSKEIAEGTRETARFSLPEEATEVEYGIGLMECCVYGSEEGFVDTMPVLPGGREVVYAYRVNYNSGAYAFSRRVNYPTASFDLLVQGEGVKVAGDQLTTAEPLNIEGMLFTHVSGRDLARGDTLVASVSNLPETDNQGVTLWVVLAVAVLVSGFSISYLLRRKRVQPVSPEGNLDQRRQRLLLELAQLDDEFEGGKIPEDVYHKLRIEKKAQLVALMQKLERKER